MYIFFYIPGAFRKVAEFLFHEFNFFILLESINCVFRAVRSSFNIENRRYREELKEALGMNFFSPFQPEREFKVYKSCKCSQIICSRVH